MKKIVAILRPFDLKQQIYVFEDGNKIEVEKTTIEELPDMVISLVSQHNIELIELSGPKQYCNGISKNITEKEFSKYNQNTLKINIL